MMTSECEITACSTMSAKLTMTGSLMTYILTRIVNSMMTKKVTTVAYITICRKLTMAADWTVKAELNIKCELNKEV